MNKTDFVKLLARNMEVAEPPYITNNNIGNFKDSNNKKPKLGLKKL